MPVPFRADHVGSFLRPPKLLAARENSDGATLKAMEDKHILRVLTKQKELGFEIFTDGELRRRNFMSNFTDAVEGFDLGAEITRGTEVWGAKGHSQDAPVSHVTGIVNAKLRQVRPVTAHELPFLKKHSPGDIKVLLPSATQFPRFRSRGVLRTKFTRTTPLCCGTSSRSSRRISLRSLPRA